jgi:hypothetical protein
MNKDFPMKKSLLLFSLYFFTTPVVAELSNINIENFRGEFISPSGSGIAQRFEVPNSSQSNQLKNVQILIEKTESGYTLRSPDNFYQWEDAPSLLMDLELANWNGITVKSQARRFETSATSLVIQRQKNQLSFRNFLVDCRLSSNAHDDFTKTLLEACLNGQSLAKLRSFQKVDKSFEGSSLLNDLLMAVTNVEIAPLSETTVENIDLKINRQAFEASLSTKVVFNTTVKVNGMVYYENDQNRIRLRLDRARAGFINVLSQVFEQLEKNQSAKLIVQRPWVTIILEDQ